jgi:CRP-like cAMP-binding protein
MKDVSPQYRDKCQQQVFAEVTAQNSILAKLKQRYVRSHLSNDKLYDSLSIKDIEIHPLGIEAFYKLVVKMQIVLSMPEQLLISQEDPPDEGESATDEPRMYFIANGRFDVFVKKNHIVAAGNGSDKSSKDKGVCSLSEGDHFGEIGLIYGCRRTASVQSTNYGTLAMLTRSNFLELQKSFESIVDSFKNQISLYEDEVKLF